MIIDEYANIQCNPPTQTPEPPKQPKAELNESNKENDEDPQINQNIANDNQMKKESTYPPKQICNIEVINEDPYLKPYETQIRERISKAKESIHN